MQPPMEEVPLSPPAEAQLGLFLGSALALDVVLHLCTYRANPGGLL